MSSSPELSQLSSLSPNQLALVLLTLVITTVLVILTLCKSARALHHLTTLQSKLSLLFKDLHCSMITQFTLREPLDLPEKMLFKYQYAQEQLQLQISQRQPYKAILERLLKRFNHFIYWCLWKKASRLIIQNQRPKGFKLLEQKGSLSSLSYQVNLMVAWILSCFVVAVLEFAGEGVDLNEMWMLAAPLAAALTFTGMLTAALLHNAYEKTISEQISGIFKEAFICDLDDESSGYLHLTMLSTQSKSFLIKLLLIILFFSFSFSICVYQLVQIGSESRIVILGLFIGCPVIDVLIIRNLIILLLSAFLFVRQACLRGSDSQIPQSQYKTKDPFDQSSIQHLNLYSQNNDNDLSKSQINTSSLNSQRGEFRGSIPTESKLLAPKKPILALLNDNDKTFQNLKYLDLLVFSFVEQTYGPKGGKKILKSFQKPEFELIEKIKQKIIFEVDEQKRAIESENELQLGLNMQLALKQRISIDRNINLEVINEIEEYFESSQKVGNLKTINQELKLKEELPSVQEIEEEFKENDKGQIFHLPPLTLENWRAKNSDFDFSLFDDQNNNDDYEVEIVSIKEDANLFPLKQSQFLEEISENEDSERFEENPVISAHSAEFEDDGKKYLIEIIPIDNGKQSSQEQIVQELQDMGQSIKDEDLIEEKDEEEVFEQTVYEEVPITFEQKVFHKTFAGKITSIEELDIKEEEEEDEEEQQDPEIESSSQSTKSIQKEADLLDIEPHNLQLQQQEEDEEESKQTSEFEQLSSTNDQLQDQLPLTDLSDQVRLDQTNNDNSTCENQSLYQEQVYVGEASFFQKPKNSHDRQADESQILQDITNISSNDNRSILIVEECQPYENQNQEAIVEIENLTSYETDELEEATQELHQKQKKKKNHKKVKKQKTSKNIKMHYQANLDPYQQKLTGFFDRGCSRKRNSSQKSLATATFNDTQKKQFREAAQSLKRVQDTQQSANSLERPPLRSKTMNQRQITHREASHTSQTQRSERFTIDDLTETQKKLVRRVQNPFIKASLQMLANSSEKLDQLIEVQNTSAQQRQIMTSMTNREKNMNSILNDQLKTANTNNNDTDSLNTTNTYLQGHLIKANYPITNRTGCQTGSNEELYQAKTQRQAMGSNQYPPQGIFRQHQNNSRRTQRPPVWQKRIEQSQYQNSGQNQLRSASYEGISESSQDQSLFDDPGKHWKGQKRDISEGGVHSSRYNQRRETSNEKVAQKRKRMQQELIELSSAKKNSNFRQEYDSFRQQNCNANEALNFYQGSKTNLNVLFP